MQPTPKITREDVERIVRRDFPAESVVEVLAILDEYGTAEYQREVDRVQLAVLKLASGNLKQLRYEIDGAKSDFREVLAPAEYPNYSKRSFRISQLPPEEQQRIIDADWKQYQDWLTR